MSSLLSLPDELLWQCLPDCDYKDKTSYLRTCSRLADVILQHEDGACLHVPHYYFQQESDQPDWRLALRKVLALCPGVRRVTFGHGELSIADEELRFCFLGNSSVPPPGVKWPNNLTAMLTHLTLQEVTISRLVPDVIAAACPNLKQLQLKWVTLKPSTAPAAAAIGERAAAVAAASTAAVTGHGAAASSVLAGPKVAVPRHLLTSLPHTTLASAPTCTSGTSTMGTLQTAAPGAAQAPCARPFPPITNLALYCASVYLGMQDVTAQLQALPNLTHLNWCIKREAAGKWDHVVQAVGEHLTQLTHLCMAIWDFDNDVPCVQWQPPKDLSPLAALTDLRIAVVVTDAIMQQLLQQLPHVQQLHVDSFKITEDYSSRQCSWQGVFMRHVIIVTLPLLPLHSVKRLGYVLWSGCDVTLPEPTDGSAEAAAAAVAVVHAAITAADRCGGMQVIKDETDWCTTGAYLNMPKHHAEQLLVACLPLLRPLASVDLAAPGLYPHRRTEDANLEELVNPHPDDVERLVINLDTITALGKHLPHLKEVHFTHCCFGPRVFTQITHVLPALQRLRFDHHCFDSIEQAVLLCGSMTRCVELCVSSADLEKLDVNYKWRMYNAFEQADVPCAVVWSPS